MVSQGLANRDLSFVKRICAGDEWKCEERGQKASNSGSSPGRCMYCIYDVFVFLLSVIFLGHDEIKNKKVKNR